MRQVPPTAKKVRLASPGDQGRPTRRAACFSHVPLRTAETEQGYAPTAAIHRQWAPD